MDRPLAVAATLLDEFVSDVERGAPLSLESIRSFAALLAPSWKAVTDNLVLASEALATPSAGSSATADRQISRRFSEAARLATTTRPLEVSNEDRRFSFARLDVMSARLAQEQLFAPRLRHGVDRMDEESLAAVEATDTRQGLVIVPVAGQFPYAVRLPKIAAANLRRMSPNHEGGVFPVSFNQVREALDPARAPVGDASLDQVLANRLTFVLAALKSSNWQVVHAICGHAIQNFDQPSDQPRSEYAVELLKDLLFARQLASRGLAAISRSNLNVQTIFLIGALEDLERLVKLDSSDLSVKLACATLENEALVLKASLGADVNNHPNFAGWVANIEIPRQIERLKIIASDLSKLVDLSAPPGSHADFTLFRVLEFLISTHLIVWSDEIAPIITTEDRAKVVQDPDWLRIFEEFRHLLSRMQKWRQLLYGEADFGPLLGPAFPFADFLLVYGEMVIRPTFAPPTDTSMNGTFDQAKTFFEMFNELNTSCENLSEHGFARRLARRAKHKIVGVARNELDFRVKRGFETLLPVNERAWIQRPR